MVLHEITSVNNQWQQIRQKWFYNNYCVTAISNQYIINPVYKINYNNYINH